MASEAKITLVAIMKVREGKRERAEKLWHALIDDIVKTEKGRVKFTLYYQEATREHVILEEWASEKVKQEYYAKPFHVDIAQKVKEEDLLEKWPAEGTEMRFLQVIASSENS